LRQRAHEERDLNVEKLRKSFESKFATLQNRIKSAEAAVERERSQARTATIDTAISIGSTLLGALFGRKVASRTNVSRASTSMRTAGRAAQQRGDVSQAQEKVEHLQHDLDALEEQFNQEVQALEEKFDVEKLEFEELSVRPRKSDIEIADVALVWTPWRVDASGIAEPLYTL
jgi:multidrug resistance efflux pump